MPLLRRTRALAVSIYGAFAALPCVPSAVAAQSTSPAVQRDGWFHVIWRDAQVPTPMRSEYYVLVDDAGTWWDLDLDPRLVRQPGGPLALDRRRVSISAERLTPGALAIGQHTPRLRVHSIGAERRSGGLRTSLAADVGAAVTGSRPYVTILCAFADAANVLPATKERMEQVMGSAYPGMDHYYREMSENLATLSGSVVVGWYTLPQPRAYYVVSGGANLNALSQDCTAAADADVDFPSFAGINLQFNQRLDCCSWGGSRVLTRDGVTRIYPMTWMADWAIGHSVYGHEIGHSFGWPHSHGAYGAQYDSKWDVMSNANNFRDPVFGWMAVHTIGFHKDRAGWIPPARKFIAPAVGSATIVLERGAIPGSGGTHLLAEIPIPGSSSYYTVEARRFAGGYDNRVPAEAVIIHRTNGFEAEVVDVDLNSNPNDAAAQWLPGETFVDSAARIAVAVVAQLGDAFQVTISTGIDLLAIALSPSSARDSAVAGSTATMDDSAAVTISGSSAGATAWSAIKRGAWVTLTGSSGSGNGMLRWRRDPTGLGPGVYVDTITVSTTGASFGTARLIDTLRILAPPSPLVLSVGVASRRDSIIARSTRLMRDSVALSFTGAGSASASWTATNHASWLTLVDASGVGGGQLRWTRDPSGLSAGTYVDTIAISASGAIGSPTRVIDTLRVLPLPSVEAAADELLGTPRLTSFERRYLDQEGNGDAVYNLGDFLAFLHRSGLNSSPELQARLLGARRKAQ